MPDGNVCLIPTGTNNVGIYSPTSNCIVASIPNTAMFIGGVLLSDSRVFLGPFGETIGFLNTQTYTLTTMDISTQAAAASGDFNGSYLGNWTGCVLTASGKVVCVPGSLYNAGIFDPVANTFTLSTPAALTIGGYLCGGVLLQTDEILCAPYSGSSIPIYNYNNDSWRYISLSNFPTITNENGGFQGGAVMPDGTVVLAPSQGSPEFIGLFNQFTNTIAYVKTQGLYTSAPFSKEFFGATLLMDGRVIRCPSESVNNGLTFYFVTQTLPATKEMCLHPFFNKL